GRARPGHELFSRFPVVPKLAPTGPPRRRGRTRRLRRRVVAFSSSPAVGLGYNPHLPARATGDSRRPPGAGGVSEPPALFSRPPRGAVDLHQQLEERRAPPRHGRLTSRPAPRPPGRAPWRTTPPPPSPRRTPGRTARRRRPQPGAATPRRRGAGR